MKSFKAFYLDGISFYRKYYLADQARAPKKMCFEAKRRGTGTPDVQLRDPMQALVVEQLK